MNSFTQHFGIGTATTMDSVVVKWPNGLRSSFKNLPTNQYHNLVECQDIVTLQAGTDDFLSGQTALVAANTSITANNKIGAAANITYQAGEFIEMQPLFETEQTANFEVRIRGCDE